MMKKIKTLHIASFIGNVGDNANHNGAEVLRNKYLQTYNFIIDTKEIREFYWKMWHFNSEEFIDEANQYDLIMIGGGNYFELWVESSHTGTSIDIALETLEKIKTPILFYGLGCDDGQGVPSENKEKFRIFVEYLNTRKNIFVSVRNDGAYELISHLYHGKFDDVITKVPDGGFFTRVLEQSFVEIKGGYRNIVINLAGDMPENRFPGGTLNSYDDFLTTFSQYMVKLNAQYNNKVNFIFACHIFADYFVLGKLMKLLPDPLRRSNLTILPYVQGDVAQGHIFGVYNQADLVLGMRFHANVCPIGLGKNTIGLVCYPQVRKLYYDLNSNDYIDVQNKNFGDELLDKSMKMLQGNHEQIDKNIMYLSSMARTGYGKILNWLNINFEGVKND